MRRIKCESFTVNCRGLCKDCYIRSEKQIKSYRDWLAGEIRESRKFILVYLKDKNMCPAYYAQRKFERLETLRQCAKQLRGK